MVKIEIEIINSSQFDWYSIGEKYTAIYDPYVGKYIAISRGGAGRYINSEDCYLLCFP